MNDRTDSSTPATIDDVARAAGVSTATVSRALRDHPYVADPTRRRVREAAERLQYVANSNAARLASGTTHTIGLLSPLLTSWYTSEVVAGVEEVCTEAGYDLLIGTADPVARTRMFRSDTRFHQRIDGVILVDVLCGEHDARQLADAGTHVVVLGEQLEAIDSVSVDNVHGGTMAATHLLQLGHRHIAIIGGRAHLDISPNVPDLRAMGFSTTLADANVTLSSHHVVDGGFSIDGGRAAMSLLLSTPAPPTAVFCMSDEMAFGALHSLRDHGLVPGVDVSVMGFDDHPVAEAIGLTTVRQPVRHIGRLGARCMLEQLGGAHTPAHHPVDLTLVARSSTGPAR